MLLYTDLSNGPTLKDSNCTCRKRHLDPSTWGLCRI